MGVVSLVRGGMFSLFEEPRVESVVGVLVRMFGERGGVQCI